MSPRYNPLSLRWTSGVWTVDDPLTGQRVPLEQAQRQEHELSLPPAAQAALDADPHLSREEAARFLGVAASTLAEWASRARGPAYVDIGQTAKYPLSALTAWRAAQIKNLPEIDVPSEPPKRGRGRPRTKPL